MDEHAMQTIGPALGRIPSGLFIVTAEHEDRRGAMLASWVQQASFHPPMVSVAIGKGRPIMPLISESLKFGLCQVPQGDRELLRRFARGFEQGEDPFLGCDLIESVLGVPIVPHVLAYLECEVAYHMDIEGDHDIFVGQVKAGRFVDGVPQVHVRENGFKY